MVRVPRLVGVVLALGAAVACSPPKKAPKDLSDLTWFLYREWPDEDPELLEEGVANLRDFLAPIAAAGNLTGDTANRSWQPAPPQLSDMTGIDWPAGKDPANCTGISIGFKSIWPIEDHAKLQLQVDQLPAEPTAKSYTRHFKTEPFSCFADRSCLEVRTYNDIVRSNITMEIQLPLFKNFRWVKLKGADGAQDRWAIIARSWIDRSLNGKDPSTGIDQSASLDVWLSISDTETWRYQAVFSETRPKYDPGLEAAVVTQSVDNTVQAGDTAIKKLFH